jgi:hypothetical protein
LRTGSLSPVRAASATVRLVARSSRALGEDDDVARHELHGGYADGRSVAHDRGHGCGEPLERGGGLLGTPFLEVSQDRVADDDGRDHEGVDGRSRDAFHGPHDQRHGDRGEQEIDERVGELTDELPPGRDGGRDRQTVRSVGDQPPLGRGARKPGVRIGLQRANDVRRRGDARIEWGCADWIGERRERGHGGSGSLAATPRARTRPAVTPGLSGRCASRSG